MLAQAWAKLGSRRHGLFVESHRAAQRRRIRLRAADLLSLEECLVGRQVFVGRSASCFCSPEPSTTPSALAVRDAMSACTWKTSVA
jgi:hypothetical protein